jgi:dTMP kinase
LERVGDERDRIEQEEQDFHDRVGAAYLEIAEKYPARFVVLDAGRPAAEIHREIVKAFEERVPGTIDPIEAGRELGPPGPVAR